MSIDSTVSAPLQQAAADTENAAEVENAADVEELLVEEVSIDGMCGVY